MATHQINDHRAGEAVNLRSVLQGVIDQIGDDLAGARRDFRRHQGIFLLDGMITTGCSLRICKQMLQPFVPDMPFTGALTSRRVLPDPRADFEDLDF